MAAAAAAARASLAPSSAFHSPKSRPSRSTGPASSTSSFAVTSPQQGRRRRRRLPLDRTRRRDLRLHINRVENEVEEDLSFDPTQPCSSAENKRFIEEIQKRLLQDETVKKNLEDVQQPDYTEDAVQQIVTKRYIDKRNEATRRPEKKKLHQQTNRRVKRRKRLLQHVRELYKQEHCQEEVRNLLSPDEYASLSTPSGTVPCAM